MARDERRPAEQENGSEESAKAAEQPETRSSGESDGAGEAEKKADCVSAEMVPAAGRPSGLFCGFCLSYRLTTRENSYSWQLRRGKALVEKEAYEEAVPYLKRGR